MRKFNCLCAVWLCFALLAPNLNAQTPNENMQKYWGTRDRLKKYFIKIGSGEGESVPAARRDHGQAFNSAQGMLKWTDACTYLGHYIGVLATEYRLLKDAGQIMEAENTLKELYYAIQAVNRLDDRSHAYFKKNPLEANNRDGWPLRDDIPENFKDNWQNTSTNWITSDAFDSEGGRNQSPQEFFGEANEPSQDQLINLMVAFALVKKCVEHDKVVQPTSQDAPLNLVTECVNITKRMMDKQVELKSTRGFNSNNEHLGLFDEQNWSFGNPVTNNAVQNGSDKLNFTTAYALAKAANYITGADYERGFRFKFFIVNDHAPVEIVLPFSVLKNIWKKRLNDGIDELCIEITPVFIPSTMVLTPVLFLGPAGFTVGALTMVIKTVVVSGVATGGISFAETLTSTLTGIDVTPFNDIFPNHNPLRICVDVSADGVNSLLTAMAIALGGPSIAPRTQGDRQFGENYDLKTAVFDVWKSEAILLLQDVLHDLEPNSSEKAKYEELLNTAPLCDGTFNFNNPDLRGANNWAKADRWLHPDIANNNNGEFGNFSGIDYMLLYNLYHYKFRSSVTLPTYKEDDYCPCDGSQFKDHNIEVPIDGSITNITFLKTVPPYNYNYNHLGIRLKKYMTNPVDVTTSSGHLKIESDFKICTGNVMNVYDHGKVTVGNVTLGASKNSITSVSFGSILKLQGDGILEIQDNSDLVIEEGASLVIEGTPQIILNGPNARLIIKGSIKLEGNDATFKPTGTGFVLFNMKSQAPHSHITANGSNCKIIFENSSWQNRMVEIASNTKVVMPDNLTLFKLYDVRIDCGNQAGFKLGCPADIDGARFNKSASSVGEIVHNALTFYGQRSVSITRSSFFNAMVAVSTIGVVNHKKINISYSLFENCYVAIKTQNTSGYFRFNRFTNNTTNWAEGNAKLVSTFEQNVIAKNKGGFFFIGGGTGPTIGFMGNLFKDNGGTIRTSGSNQTFLACNQFYNNGDNGIFSGKTILHASTGSAYQLKTNDGLIVLSGHNLFQTGYTPSPYYVNNPNYQPIANSKGITIGDATRYYFDEGYNKFVNNHSPGTLNIGDHSINSDLARPIVLYPNGYDDKFNNNSWYPDYPIIQPASMNILTLQNGTPFGNGWDIHLDMVDLSNGVHSPSIIYGNMKASSLSCPIPDWNDALGNPYAFDAFGVMPTTYINGAFSDNLAFAPGSGGPGGVRVASVTPTIIETGPYAGQNYREGAVAALDAVYSGGRNDEGWIISTEGLTALGDLILLTATVTSDADREIWESLYKSYIPLIYEAQSAGNFDNDPTVSNPVISTALTIIDAALAQNNVLTTHEYVRYQNKLAYSYDKANMFNSFNGYSQGLPVLNAIGSFVQEKDLASYTMILCMAENEKLYSEGAINRLQLEDNVNSCLMTYLDEQIESCGGIADTFAVTNDSLPPVIPGPSYTLAPNPATASTNVDLTLTYDADVIISVFNKFGVKAIPDMDLGSMLAGQYLQEVVLTGLPTDIYNMVVYVNGIPYVKHFVKLAE